MIPILNFNQGMNVGLVAQDYTTQPQDNKKAILEPIVILVLGAIYMKPHRHFEASLSLTTLHHQKLQQKFSLFCGVTSHIQCDNVDVTILPKCHKQNQRFPLDSDPGSLKSIPVKVG